MPLAERDNFYGDYCRLTVAFPTQESQHLFLRHLRWGESLPPQEVGSDREWIVEALELRRVYATLENFPIEDMFDPVECAIHSTHFEVDVSMNPSIDERYSTGFVLPLILGALQAAAGSSASTSPVSVYGKDAFAEKAVHLAQRLCEKGALALAVASLSSKCSLLRKLSVATIGLFIEAVNSRYAQQMVTWRERPQIAMVLDAVQRSLVLRFATEKEHTGLSSYVIPELPCFSAIFLARATILLSRPSDPLYQAINRAFLRAECDGGAFQDMTRLPVFMSLFCSPSEDLLMQERKFAVELVNNGMVGEECYKLLVSCHCPSLLLNAIESASVMSSVIGEDEVPRLFRTLRKLVAVGGERASSHLLSRVGLLSWLRSFLLGNKVKSAYRQSFLELLTIAAERTSDIVSSEEFSAMTRGVAEGTMALFMEASEEERRLAHDFPTTILACRLLPALATCTTVNGVLDDDVQADGVRLSTAIEFISSLHTAEELCAGLLSICRLPLNCDARDASQATALCALLLESTRKLENCDSSLILTTLQRLKLLGEQITGSLLEKTVILRGLLSWRSECCYSIQTHDAWRSCLVSFAAAVDGARLPRTLLDVSTETDLVFWAAHHERRLAS
jgi:Nucleolar pre-ribosomal-associated protein 1